MEDRGWDQLLITDRALLLNQVYVEFKRCYLQDNLLKVLHQSQVSKEDVLPESFASISNWIINCVKREGLTQNCTKEVWVWLEQEHGLWLSSKERAVSALFTFLSNKDTCSCYLTFKFLTKNAQCLFLSDPLSEQWFSNIKPNELHTQGSLAFHTHFCTDRFKFNWNYF